MKLPPKAVEANKLREELFFVRRDLAITMTELVRLKDENHHLRNRIAGFKAVRTKRQRKDIPDQEG